MKNYVIVVLAILACNCTDANLPLIEEAPQFKKVPQWEQVLPGSNVESGRIVAQGDSVLIVSDNNEGSLMLSIDNGVTWSSINGDQKRVRGAVSFVIRGPNIYVGTWFGEVYQSTNGGKNWRQLGQGLDNQIMSLAVIDNDIFAIIAKIYPGERPLNCLYHLNLRENTWIPCTNGVPTNIDGACLLVRGKRILASMTGGTFCSDDNGISWSRVSLEKFNRMVGSNNVILALSSAGGVAYSHDNGQTWHGIAHLGGVMAIAVNPKGIFVGCSGQQGVYFSPDLGSTWSPISNVGLPFYNSLSNAIQVILINGMAISKDKIYALALVPSNEPSGGSVGELYQFAFELK